ncbi:lipopolysaccharide kinase InaA family protein [Gammaproteobacteria bacterium AB-CW1]|uniref:Lipopolysaccharide kinase InaA family protein n=1 Tax=Natronospira elongata TaxID=3110268 RepID=A0AAP6MJC9_9GAMM|nr:lipopolysaccharide kinase InaA family protein [Gammaproteobacteria bacterium AB-CW1]
MRPTALTESEQGELLSWTQAAIESGQHKLSRGYQGQVLLYQDGDRALVIKAPPRSLYRWLSIRMLRREARVYEQLEGIEGIPRCLGLLGGRFLVLEYIPGDSLRHAQIPDPADFFQRLLRIIRRMHAAGVGHADLKRKDNILVDEQGRPWVIDFGVATLRRRGWRPINRFLFNTARRFDLNAWVKHKYRRRLDQVDERDRRYLHYTWMERWGRRIKQFWRKLTGPRIRERDRR